MLILSSRCRRAVRPVRRVVVTGPPVLLGCVVLVALGAILFWFLGVFALVGRSRPGVVVRYVVAMVRQSNEV